MNARARAIKLFPPLQGRLSFEAHESRLDGEFRTWRGKHPEVWTELLRICRRKQQFGYRRWSVNAAFEIVRWDRDNLGIPSSDEEFKLNNNLRSRVARAVMAENPDLVGFFETRELHS